MYSKHRAFATCYGLLLGILHLLILLGVVDERLRDLKGSGKQLLLLLTLLEHTDPTVRQYS
jgi:hypothetical protein